MQGASRLVKADFEALSEFRHQLRRFLRFSEEAAKSQGLTPLQYQLLLHVKGYPGRSWPTIGELAERLQTAQHGVVSLVTRCQRAGLVERRPGTRDRRDAGASHASRGASGAADHQVAPKRAVVALERVPSDSALGVQQQTYQAAVERSILPSTFESSMQGKKKINFGIDGAQARLGTGVRSLVCLVSAIGSSCASAHALGQRPDEAWSLPWSFEPWVIICLCASGALYAVGLLRLWAHAGAARGVSTVQMAAFAAGWLVLVLALVTPLDPLGSQLFSAHMVQHELLMIVAAPLLVLGRPLAVWTWALPFQWRRAAGHFFHAPAWRIPWLIVTGPFVAWVLHALALWLWHLPSLFDAALSNEAVHALQHSAFLLTALLFWWSIFGSASRKERGIALLSLFTTMVHTGALGALLTLSKTPWYPSYFATAPIYGLNALEDQQLGGLIMWIPAGLIYIVCGLALASRWIATPRPRPQQLATR